MVDPQFYAVASDGTATPPSGPTGVRSTRAPSKTRPRFPVPTDRMKFETQVQALRTICTASRGGQESVDAEKMASLMGVSSATAPLNNAFFISVGLVEKIGKGEYRPTELALKFQQKWTFNKDEAPTLLAPAFHASWFFEAVKQKLDVDGAPTVKQMIETLAMRAGTDDTYATQYSFLLDWLAYVGLIAIESDIVRIVSEASVEPELETEEDKLPAVPSEPETHSKSEGPKMVPLVKAQPPVIAFSFEVAVTAADLAILAPEQIAAFFDGAGKIAAIQALLSQQ